MWLVAATQRRLEKLADARRRRRTGSEMVKAYCREPQTQEELAGLDQATRVLIDEEPWEPPQRAAGADR
jgi:hypothetical protein